MSCAPEEKQGRKLFVGQAFRRARAAFVAGVQRAARLDQQHLHLALGKWLVLDALRHDDHLARPERDETVAEIDAQRTLQHDEGLVGLLVIVPDEIALDAHDLELVVVQFRNHARLPLVGEERELLGEIDRRAGFRRRIHGRSSF